MATSLERTPSVVVDAGAGKGGPRGQQVVEILRSAIITGDYEPGERLILSISVTLLLLIDVVVDVWSCSE